MNLGCCSITRAEMRGIMEGLKLAWSLVIRKIRVQSDSAADIAILSNGSLLDHQHIYREANCAADYLANIGYSFLFGLHIVSVPDRGLSHWLHYDIVGVSLPRSVGIFK
ncbi:Putative ribonuclease H protein At1g65750 [Linum grandiflorum]